MPTVTITFFILDLFRTNFQWNSKPRYSTQKGMVRMDIPTKLVGKVYFDKSCLLHVPLNDQIPVPWRGPSLTACTDYKNQNHPQWLLKFEYGSRKGCSPKLLNFGTSSWHSNDSAFFPPLLRHFLIEGVLRSKNLFSECWQEHPKFQTPLATLGLPSTHFGFWRWCSIACGEWVPPLPLGSVSMRNTDGQGKILKYCCYQSIH